MSDDAMIRSIIKDLGRKLGTKASVGIMGDAGFAAEPSDFVKSSSTLLNQAIGGGAAVGRIMEIMGDVQTGKSLLLMDMLGNNQRAGGLSFYEDAEYGTSKDFAKRLGHVDDETLGHLHVSTQEDAWTSCFEIIETARTHSKDQVVAIGLDSLAALPSAEEKAATMDENSSISKSARVIRGALRKLTSEISNEKVCFIFTNHEICKIGGMSWGEKTVSWGGTAPKYFASTRIKLDVIKTEKINDDIVALRVRATVVKNRFDPPGRKIEYFVNVRGPYLGIDDRASIIEYLTGKGAFGSKKGWLQYEGAQMRKTKLLQESWDKPEVYQDLQKKALHIFNSGASYESEDLDGVVEGI